MVVSKAEHPCGGARNGGEFGRGQDFGQLLLRQQQCLLAKFNLEPKPGGVLVVVLALLRASLGAFVVLQQAFEGLAVLLPKGKWVAGRGVHASGFGVVCLGVANVVSGFLGQGAFNCANEFFARKGFGEVVSGAYQAASSAVDQAVFAGEHDYRQIFVVGVVFNNGAGLEAVYARHHDV